MASTILKRSIQLLLRSLPGQACVLACGALLAAMALLALDGVRAGVVLTLVMLLTSGMAAFTAFQADAGYVVVPAEVPFDMARLAPRLLTQSAIVATPLLAAAIVTMLAARFVPALSFVIMLVAIPAASLVVAPMFLVLGSAAGSDRTWLPARAAYIAFRSGRTVQVYVIGIAAAIMCCVASLPLVITATVVGTQLGPLAPVGFGVAMIGVAPLLGCTGAAMWWVCAIDVIERVTTDGEGPDAIAPPPSGILTGDPLEALGVTVTQQPIAWAQGPTWDIALDSGAVWGAWIRMPAASRVALQVRWHAGAAPHVAIATKDGVWSSPGVLPATGEPLEFELDAGDVYVQLTSAAGIPQAINTVLLVPGVAAA